MDYPLVVSISSGKGGVGKTCASVNLALAFAGMGKKVLLVDADLSLGNICSYLGLAPRYDVRHVLGEEVPVGDVLVRGPSDILVLPAASGTTELTTLNPEQKLTLASCIEVATTVMEMDIVILDNGSGVSSNVLFFNSAAEELVVVTTPEYPAIAGTYGLVKALVKGTGRKNFRLIVNRTSSEDEGKEVYRELSLMTANRLNISLGYLGCVPEDGEITATAKTQKPVMEIDPAGGPGRGYRRIALDLLDYPSSVCFSKMMSFRKAAVAKEA